MSRRTLIIAAGITAAGLLLAPVLVMAALRARRGPPPPSSHAMAAAHAHPANASMMTEHRALLELLPGEDHATHVAAASGAWFDPGTWAAGTVPGEGAIVYVPAGTTVTYAGASPAHVFLVRVDGALSLEAPEGLRTALVVDTLLSIPESRLSIEADEPTDGTIELVLRPFDIRAHEERGAPGWSPAAVALYSDGAPVYDTEAATRAPAGLEAVDDGPGVLGRYEWDPLQLSLALISHGQARILGQPKLATAVLARAARRGDDTLLLDRPPRGWRVGDRVVLVGTRYVGRGLVAGDYLGSEDELRTIVALGGPGGEGHQVRLDRPLDFDHEPQRADLSVHVSNLTRNVSITSSAEQDLEHLEAAWISARASNLGHVMFMHDEQARVSHASFHALGRTNKNVPADDFQRYQFDGLDAGRTAHMVAGVREPRKTPPDQVTNPRGRYAVHMHRTGALRTDATATVEGCVVTGGPGWGFVSHDSRADFRDNVTYGVLGAGFVAETGNETGRWERNVAINTYGADFNSPALDPRGLYRYENDDFNPTLLLEKRGAWKNHDFGHLGDGFWFQGKLIEVVDNVSASSGLVGYFYMFRAPDQINVDPAVLDEPRSVHSPEGIHPVAPGLKVFTGNRSVADRCGLAMIGIGGGRTNDERSVIADFIAWEVGQIGTHSQYYPGYTIKDSSFLASTSPSAYPLSGVSFLKLMVDVVLANLTIEGFPQQYDLRKSWSPGTINLQGFEDPYVVSAAALQSGASDPLPLGYAHVLIDAGFTREQAPQRAFMASTYREEDLILTSDQLVPGRFEVALDDESLRVDLDLADVPYGWLPDDPIRPTMQEGHVLLLRGVKTDSIGSIPIDYHNNVLVWHAEAVQHRLESAGYYRMPSGALGVVLEEVFADRYTAEKHVVTFAAELDRRWDLSGAVDRGEFDPRDHPDVHVPAFLLAP